MGGRGGASGIGRKSQSALAPKANTKDVTYKIQHGIVSYDDSRGIESYGIRWDKVSSVSGQTYNIRSMLKEKGFRWDGKTKSWVKKD